MAEAGGSWDDDNFEPTNVNAKPVVTDRWEGEDEPDEVKDNWDDEEEESEQKPAVQVKTKKKPLAVRIAEKEAKRKAEIEAEKKAMEEENNPVDQLSEKLRQQRLQEEADLQITKEAFGISNDELAGRTGIDGMDPSSKQDFDEFETALKDKICKYDNSAFYCGFLENLYRDLALSLEAEEVKKLSSTITALANEKTKAQKAGKKKKPKKVGVVKMDREEDNLDDGYGQGDFDDFI